MKQSQRVEVAYVRPDPYMEVTIVPEGQLHDHKQRGITAIGRELLAGLAIVAVFAMTIAAIVWLIT
jgi:hypothetical protein